MFCDIEKEVISIKNMGEVESYLIDPLQEQALA
jgi:hypothetical protein